jgi:hypothetical protein
LRGRRAGEKREFRNVGKDFSLAKCRKINLCEERRNARKKVYPPEEN